MSNDRNFGILGFLAGAAVGATLGILFAPSSGKKTRQRIAKRVSHAKDDLDDLIDKGRDEWAKAKGKVSDTASMTKDEVNDFIRFLMEEGRDLKDRLGRDVEDAADNVTSKAKRAADNVRQSAN
ncbi:MAG: YtxH domain-containing protein [Flavobacteriales bacterium]|nr:YtxH domain-containing protein [Flavobacteriales bacterium]